MAIKSGPPVDSEMSTAELLAVGFLGVLVAGPLLVKVAGLGGRVTDWARGVGIFLPPGSGVLTIPVVGDVDGARLLFAVSAVVFAASVVLVGRRVRRRSMHSKG